MGKELHPDAQEFMRKAISEVRQDRWEKFFRGKLATPPMGDPPQGTPPTGTPPEPKGTPLAGDPPPPAGNGKTERRRALWGNYAPDDPA